MVTTREPPPSLASALPPEWEFQLSSQPITCEEQHRFRDELASLGVDEHVWDVFNSVLATGSRYSRPLALRAFDVSGLVGIAFIYECRRTGECFFDPPYSTLMDIPATPMFVWLRYGVTVDHFANPGFVVDCNDRELFVERAARFLLRQYLFGTVVEFRDSVSLPGAVKSPFVDNGVIDLMGIGSVEDYTGRGKNLPRKLKKFRNKGGEIRIIKGVLPDELREAALQAFDTLTIAIRTPYQDNYLDMAGAGMSSDDASNVHVVALLDGVYVGHQSFCHSGHGLACQSGAFDRARKSTYHAYENIIVASVEYALEHRLQRIDYGPTTNETKAKMMTDFIPCENRTYARYRPIAAALPLILNRSKISPARMAQWCNLGDQARENEKRAPAS